MTSQRHAQRSAVSRALFESTENANAYWDGSTAHIYASLVLAAGTWPQCGSSHDGDK
ncbi:hypothetical protein T09_1242 [Trichinella sp. T9]|nr:hypothetical protein T09_1242 [Trichinella sp. T9]